MGQPWDRTRRASSRWGISWAVLALVLVYLVPSAPALGASKTWDEFLSRHPGTWQASAEEGGRISWLVGDGYTPEPGANAPDLGRETGLATLENPYDRADDTSIYAPEDGGDKSGPTVDLAGIPRFVEVDRISLALRYRDLGSGVDPKSVRVERNAQDITGLFALGPDSAETWAPVDLEEGPNVVSITLRDLAGNETVDRAVVERLTKDEVTQVAVSRAFLEEVAPALGIDLAGGMELVLSRIETGFLPIPEQSLDVPVSVLVYVPRFEGVPVLGAKVGTLVFQDPKGVPRAAGAIPSLGPLAPPRAKIEDVMGLEAARQALAKAIAEGDSRLVTTPILCWHADGQGGLRPAYLAQRYGLAPADLDRGDSVRDAFTTARAVVDAISGEPLETGDLMVDFRTVDTARPVIDGPPGDLDRSLQVRTVREVRVEGTGALGTTYFAEGPNAKVLNNSQAVLITLDLGPVRIPLGGSMSDGGDPVSFNPFAEIYFGDYPAPDLDTGGGDNSHADDMLDAWTAYYHTDLIARFLYDNIRFRHQFPRLPLPSQMIVGVNPSGITNNAAAAPTVTASAGTGETTLDRAGIVFGTGVGYAPTRSGGRTRYARADFTREKGVIYHEYGHTILFRKGFLPSMDASILASAVHEGFSDYVARVVQGGEERILTDFLIQGNRLDPGVRRLCAPVLPDSESFVTVDADNQSGSISSPHLSGQALCQALARAEERSVRLGVGRRPHLLWAAVVSASLWDARDRDASSVARGLLAADAFRWVILRLFWIESRRFDHEIKTAMAIHGLVEREDGREAALSLGLGNGATYGAGADTSYVVATGTNTNYVLEFSTDAPRGPVCHRERGESRPVGAGRTTRWNASSFSLGDLIDHCMPGGAREAEVFVHAVSCTRAADCRDPLAQDAQEMSASALSIRVVR